MYDRILVPLDGSESSELILPHATALARAFAATVVLLRVVTSRAEALRQTMSPEPMTAASLSSDVANELVDAQAKAAHRYLDGIAARLTTAGIRAETLVGEGEASIALLQVIRDQSISFVAMVAHHHSALGRLVVGSVSTKVISDAKVPVFDVAGDD